MAAAAGGGVSPELLAFVGLIWRNLCRGLAPPPGGGWPPPPGRGWLPDEPPEGLGGGWSHQRVLLPVLARVLDEVGYHRVLEVGYRRVLEVGYQRVLEVGYQRSWRGWKGCEPGNGGGGAPGDIGCVCVCGGGGRQYAAAISPAFSVPDLHHYECSRDL